MLKLTHALIMFLKIKELIINLGYFESKEEAIEARNKAEETYFKEFRAQNIYNISNSSNITINNS